jgi:hydrogenase maturation protease
VSPGHETIVVIGVGNSTRGDDAIGGLAAQALAKMQLPEIRVVEVEGDATQLLEAFACAADVIVIDACQSGAAVGTIHRFDAAQERVPANIGCVSSHGFGLAAALELARTFEKLPRRCVVLAVEGEDFTHGASLSPPVAACFDELMRRVEQEIGHMRQASAP